MMSIMLHGDEPPRTVAGEHVYFPFASGRLAYDCAACGAKCCRGHGYQSCRGAELDTQMRMRPELRFFVDATAASAAMVRIRNFTPACFFLAADNRCDIHRAHGARAKPETCRFFPFNQFLRVDDYLVVLPHPVICPLRVMTGADVSGESDHSLLLGAMAESGIAARPIPVAVQGPVGTIVERERLIVKAAESHREATRYEPFAVRQLAFERPLGGHSSHAENEAQRSVAAFSEILWMVLGSSRPADDPVVTRLTIALSPLLRAYLVFRPADGTAARGDVDDARLPFFLTAVHALATLASKAGAEMTYQTMTQLFRDAHPLIATLAYLDTVVVWRGESEAAAADRQASAFVPAAAVVAALQRSRQERRQLRLGELLCAHAPAADVDRVLFLKGLGRLLCGRIVTLQHTDPPDGSAVAAARFGQGRRSLWRPWRARRAASFSWFSSDRA